MKENDIEEIIIHAPYIINLGNTVKPETFEIAETFLGTELERSSAMGSKVMVFTSGLSRWCRRGCRHQPDYKRIK